MNDQEILQLIRKKEHHTAVGKLYEHFPKIRSLIRMKGGNADDASDVFQESLIIFCKKTSDPSFKLTSGIGTYLYSVCWHLWKDALQKRHRNIPTSDMTETLPSASEEVQHHLEKEEKFGYLDKVLMEIGEKCREIFQLYYFKKQSMQQIAAQLGFGSEQTAKNQKYKCLEKAKELAKQIASIH